MPIYIWRSLFIGSARRVLYEMFNCVWSIHLLCMIDTVCFGLLKCATVPNSQKIAGLKDSKSFAIEVSLRLAWPPLRVYSRPFVCFFCVAPDFNGNQKGTRWPFLALGTNDIGTEADSVHPVRRPPNTACTLSLGSLFGELPFSHSLWFPSQETTKSFSHRHAH